MSEESPLQNPGELTEHPLCILCVDDEVDILASLTRLFRREPFKVLTATSGEEGLALLKRTENVGLIISDYRMPVMNGSTFLKSAALLAPDSYRMILTGYADMNAAIEAINEGGASRFMSKPAENDELLHTVRDGLLLYRKTRENQRLTALVTQQNEELEEWNANLKKRVLQQTAQLRKQFEKQFELQKARTAEICNAVVFAFTDILGNRNSRFSSHSRSVATLADQIARQLGLSDQLCEDIRVAALLHDIGSLGLPDRLLLKCEDAMSPDELKEFQSHSIAGGAAVEKIEVLREVGVLIRHHHEAYDGSGYPDGLAGEQIPLGARIIALASWIENAIAGESDPVAHDLVIQRLDWEMGSLFDPALSAAAKSAMAQLFSDSSGMHGAGITME